MEDITFDLDSISGDFSLGEIMTAEMEDVMSTTSFEAEDLQPALIDDLMTSSAHPAQDFGIEEGEVIEDQKQMEETTIADGEDTPCDHAMISEVKSPGDIVAADAADSTTSLDTDVFREVKSSIQLEISQTLKVRSIRANLQGLLL